jgi:hypothetical protein
VPSALADVPVDVPAPVAAGGRSNRLPATVAAAALLAVLQALGLLALGLTSLDGVFGTGVRPDGPQVAVTLLLLAGWVVLCAGGGASVIDGVGRQLMVAVACGELVLLMVAIGAAALGGGGVLLVALGPLGALPVPALAVLTAGVPIAKLLLASAPSTVAWVGSGGRPAAARAPRGVEHRALRGVTVACIGLALTGVALLGGPADTSTTPSTAAVVDGP